MSRARALGVGIVGLLLAVVVGGAAASGPSVTITSPRTGTSYSAKKVKTIPVAGTVAFASAAPTSSKFYLRRDGCGTANDNPHLSLTSGTDAGEGCGFIGGSGFLSDASKSLFSVDFPSIDGMPLVLDSSRDITGTLDLQNDVAGTGQVTLDFTAEALVNGEGIVVGTDTETVLVTPAQSDYPVTFHITPTATLNQKSLSGIDLNVYPHGAYADSGYIGLSGKSWMTVPGFSASPDRAVQLSLDDATFANPIAATLNSSATGFTASIPTPAIGTHTLYAEATQGFDTSAAASTKFTVKR